MIDILTIAWDIRSQLNGHEIVYLTLRAKFRIEVLGGDLILRGLLLLNSIVILVGLHGFKFKFKY